MIKSIHLYFSMAFLFAFAQIGMPVLTMSHWVDCHVAQHQDQQHQGQGDAEHVCEQCLSLNHAADANVARDFHVAVMDFGYLFVVVLLTYIATKKFSSLSVRAPPEYSQIQH